MNSFGSHNVSLHGINEFVRFRSAKKFVWITFMIILISCACYNSWNMVEDLRHEPITTYVQNYKGNQHYPTITVCPTHLKYDLAKVKNIFRKLHTDEYRTTISNQIRYYADNWLHREHFCHLEELQTVIKEFGENRYDSMWNLGMNRDLQDKALMYLSSLETMNYVKGVYGQASLVGFDENGIARYSETEIDDLIDDVWLNWIGNRSYEDVELDLTVDFDLAVVEKPGYPIKNRRKIMTTYGVCYSFDVAPNMDMGTVGNFMAAGTRFEFALPRDPNIAVDDYRAEHMPVSQNADLLFFGETGFWPKSPPQSIQQATFQVPDTTKNESVYRHQRLLGYATMAVRADFKYDLLLSSITFNRLNLRRRHILICSCYRDIY